MTLDTIMALSVYVTLIVCAAFVLYVVLWHVDNE